mgnify:CR=1 FL=1
MNVMWVSANMLGLELLKECRHFFGDNLTILTLSSQSKTVMYDSVEASAWSNFNAPVIEVDKTAHSVEIIKQCEPDVVIMCGWRQIITRELLDIPKFGWIGFHPTLLPKGRGPAPIINSILQGWKQSGLSMFYLTEGLDDGDIIAQESFMIEEDDYAMDVYNKVIKAGKKIVSKYVPRILDNTVSAISQNNSHATFFNKPKLKDNEINLLNDSSETIYKKIRALSHPYKGAYIKVGADKLIIWKASRVHRERNTQGI